MHYPRQLCKSYIWCTLIVSEYLRLEHSYRFCGVLLNESKFTSSKTLHGFISSDKKMLAGRKNITLFDGDPLSGAMVSDDICFAHLYVEVQSTVWTCDNHHLYVLIIACWL